MEPVEIDIRMRQNVDSESEKAVKGVDEINASIIQVNSLISRHQGAVLDLKKDIYSLGTAYKLATKAEKSGILSEIEITKKNILDEKEAIKQLEAEYKQLQKTKKTPAVSPNESTVASAGRAGVGYNNLGFSVQQIVREMPAAAMGINTLFLAVSNNVPILTDNIKRAKAELVAMKAAGQEGTPVWKQLLGSILSWQSLMMVGITVFSMYGKEIIGFFTKTSAATERANEDAKKFNDSFGSSVGKPLALLKLLSDSWNGLGDNLSAKKKFVDDNKDSFQQLGVEVNNVADAENILVANKDNFILSIVAKAKAAASMDLAAEKYKQAMQKMLEADKMSDTVDVFTSGGQSVTGGGTISKSTVTNNKKVAARKEANDILAEGDRFIKESNKQTEVSNKLLAKSGIDKYEKEKKERHKAAKEEYDAEKALQKELLDINNKKNELLLAQREDSLAKTLAEIDREKELELQKIEANQKEIVEKYNKSNKDKKGFKALSTSPENLSTSIATIDPTLSKSIEESITNLKDAYLGKRKAAEQKYYDDITKLAEKHAEERVKIEHDYNADIIKLVQAGEFEAAGLATIERNKKVSEVTAGLITETQAYKLASSDKLDVSRATTARLIDDIKKRIDAEVTAGKLTKQAADKMKSDLDSTQVGKSTNSANPFSNLINGLSEYKKAKDALAKGKDTANPAEFAKLEDAANKSLKSTAGAAGAALDGVGSILSSVVGGLDQLGMLTDEQKKDANDVIGMVSGAATLAKGIASGNPIDIITGSVGLLTSAFSLFDRKSKDIAKKQKEHKKNIADLERAYTQLQYAVDKALGTDVYSAQKNEIENSKKQIAEYEAWIVQERRKKKKKQDQEAIKDAQAKIQELKNNITDQVQAITESLAQTSAKDLASNLAEALVGAFQTGEDAATAMGNVINDVLKNAVVNSLKLKFLEKPLNDAVNYLGSAMGDGELNDAEKKVFGSMVTSAGQNFNTALAAYDEILGKTDAARTGSSKGIATADQTSINELNGGVYALRSGVADIRNYERELLLIEKARDAQMNQLVENTSFIEKIYDELQDIKIKGINIKV